MAEPAKKLDPFEGPKKPPQKPDLEVIQGGKSPDEPSELGQADLTPTDKGQQSSSSSGFFDTIYGDKPKKTKKEPFEWSSEEIPEEEEDEKKRKREDEDEDIEEDSEEGSEEGVEGKGGEGIEESSEELGEGAETVGEAGEAFGGATEGGAVAGEATEAGAAGATAVGGATEGGAAVAGGAATSEIWGPVLIVIIVIVLILLLLAAVVGMGFLGYNLSKSSEDTEQDGGNGITSEGAAKIVAVAQKEVGTCGSGGNNCGAPTKYHCNGCIAWCAAFVSWTYKEAGYPFKSGNCGGWSIWGGAALQGYFYENEVYLYPDPKTPPQPGDVIGFKPTADASGHVGIVKSYNPSNGEITTIEGNTTGDCVKEKNHNIKDSNIQMFGRLQQFD